jgi:5'-methylthioadenosine phosphorylase
MIMILPSVPGASVLMETPYGPVAGVGHMLQRTADARAAIYAAKALGARRVLAADVVQAVSPLLEPGDIVIPADVIDQTRLRPFTFFVGKGYGFIKLNPPFCPDLTATLVTVARRHTARTFRGATYVCTDGPRAATPAERQMYRHWGADLVGSGLLPEAYLARELELCYAAITAVGDGSPLADLLAEAAAEPRKLDCTCGDTMKLLKADGVVGEDWRTW